MSRFPGNIIKLPNVTPTQSSAQGVWSLKDQLVYQRNNQWPFQRDPYFNYTTLLLQGNVPNTTGPQAMTQPLAYNSDASTNNFLVTPNGEVSPRPFSPYGGGAYSNFFDGSGDYLTATNSSAFYLSTGNFTVEAWLYKSASGTGIIVGQTQNSGAPYNGWLMYVTSGNLIRFEGSNGVSIQSTGTFPLNQWVHVAAVRVGSTTTLYMDGSAVGTGSVSITDFSGVLTIGQYTTPVGGSEWNGYISNLRIVKGTAVYTSNFTPPTQPLQNITNTSLLTCQSNRFIDNGTANSGSGFAITVNGTPRVTDNSPFVSTDFTTGAGYFNGASGSNLAFATGSFVFGNSDFTIEAWVYNTGTTTGTFFNGQYTSGASTTSIIGAIGSSNGNFDMYIGSSVYSLTGINPALNQWVHLAIVRTGGTVSVFQNGNRTHTRSDLSTLSINAGGTTVAPQIGNSLAGYLSNHRIIIGGGPYDATQTSIPIPTAPLAVTANTKLLTLQTRAASQNIGFIDSSPNEFIVTKNGNTTQGTFSPFSPTGWGAYGSGTTSYAQLNNADYAISTGDFTIEFWMYLTSDKATTCFCSATSNPNLTVAMTGGSSGARLFYMEYGGTGTTFGAGSNYLNKWTHVAFVRSSGVVTCYQDGNATNPGGTTRAAAVGSTANLYLLRNSGDTSQDLPGYVSNFRICKSAVYGANFSPSTSALTTTSQNATNCVLLTFQNNRFRDNSSNNSTVTPSANLSVQAFSPFAPATQSSPLVTGGSGYFDGTGSGTAADYLTVPDSPVFTLGSGDFTLETWIYSTVGSGAERYYIAHTDNATAAASQFALYQRSADAFILFEYYVSTTANSITSGAAITLNQWNHIAVCRSNGTLSMFVNGVRPATGTTNISTTAFNDSASSLGIGGRTSGAALLTGNICGMRLVRGTDIYGASNTTIVVPTAPPTAIPNTSLLLNFTGGGIVDATGQNNLETVANAQISTVQAKWGPGSMYFNGTTNYLKSPASPAFNCGTGNWTIEGWVYISSYSTNFPIMIGNNNGTFSAGALGFTAQNAGNNKFSLAAYDINPSAATLIASSTNSLNTWYYVALVRNGTSLTLYRDGVSVASTNISASVTFDWGKSGLLVAGAGWDGAASYFNGYIDDLRITKGYARYVTGTGGNAGQMVFNGTNTLALPTGPFPIG